jgi:hypothetical protein
LPIAADNAASFTKKWQKRGVKATYVRENVNEHRRRAAGEPWEWRFAATSSFFDARPSEN